MYMRLKVLEFKGCWFKKSKVLNLQVRNANSLPQLLFKPHPRTLHSQGFLPIPHRLRFFSTSVTPLQHTGSAKKIKTIYVYTKFVCWDRAPSGYFSFFALLLWNENYFLLTWFSLSVMRFKFVPEATTAEIFLSCHRFVCAWNWCQSNKVSTKNH